MMNIEFEATIGDETIAIVEHLLNGWPIGFTNVKISDDGRWKTVEPCLSTFVALELVGGSEMELVGGSEG